MKILCIGEALIDMICTDKGKSLSEGDNFLKKPGGAPTNVAAAIAALGGQVELAAKVGVDPFGKHLIEVMQSFGVSTKWVLQDEHYFTTFAFVSLMENGERDFYFNRGADGQLNISEVEAIDLDEVSIIHFGSATGFLPGPLQDDYKGLLQKALQKNILISFDPNYRHLLFKNNTEKLWELANSEHLWSQRISVLATFYFIRQGEFIPTMELSKYFLKHEHDLIHKATGWMLREVGKRDVNSLYSFLNKFHKTMPRTMLRYAVEKIPPQQRIIYMKK